MVGEPKEQVLAFTIGSGENRTVSVQLSISVSVSTSDPRCRSRSRSPLVRKTACLSPPTKFAISPGKSERGMDSQVTVPGSRTESILLPAQSPVASMAGQGHGSDGEGQVQGGAGIQRARALEFNGSLSSTWTCDKQDALENEIASVNEEQPGDTEVAGATSYPPFSWGDFESYLAECDDTWVKL